MRTGSNETVIDQPTWSTLYDVLGDQGEGLRGCESHGGADSGEVRDRLVDGKGGVNSEGLIRTHDNNKFESSSSSQDSTPLLERMRCRRVAPDESPQGRSPNTLPIGLTSNRTTNPRADLTSLNLMTLAPARRPHTQSWSFSGSLVCIRDSSTSPYIPIPVVMEWRLVRGTGE